MKAKHTPGPWSINEQFICDVQAGGYKIATAWSEDEAGRTIRIPNGFNAPTPEEQEANARLIAAAPEMLDMLKGTCLAFKGLADHYKTDGFMDFYAMVLEVVRKEDPEFEIIPES